MQRTLHFGILFMLVSTLSYSLLAAIVKFLDNSIPVPMIVFVQSMVCLFLSLPMIMSGGIQKFKQRIQSNNKRLHFIRAVFSLGISCFMFLSVSRMPLVNAMLLANTAPFMVPLVGAMFMQHSLNHRIWLPLLLGFIGVIFVLHPDKGIFQLAAIYALAAALCMAISTLLIRRTSLQDSAFTISFYYCLFAAILSSAIAIFFWQPITLQQCFILIVVGVLFFICQYSLSLALWHISAQLASSLYYSNIVFASILSWLIWGATLSFNTLMGIIFIFIGGILCVNTQHRHEKHIRQAATGMTLS